MSARSPAMVAWATLMLLDDPSDLARRRAHRRSQDGPRRTSGNDTRTGGGRLHRTRPCAGLADDRVGDGRPGQGHAEQALLGLLDALLNGQAGFLGLSVTQADGAGAVPDHHESGETEPPAALDDLGDPVDLDRSVLVLLLLGHLPLELQSASGRVG